MKHFAERTCTVVRERTKEAGPKTESGLTHGPESRPLESFRDEPAYVLLGSPGSGKTDAFKHEARHEGVEPITARDFRTFDPDPDWQDQTLYIDGLDETRAGSADGRTPFDAIRARLQALGRPRFRVSCREADWFGANDRERLKAVAPNGEVLVLRLDPLSDQGILDILDKNLGVEDPQGFVEAARQRGVDGLLRNPLNLEMLAAAVGDEEWPRTKTETFDMACRKLVSEDNPEHQIAWSGSADTAALLDAAGHLCAVLLLAGKAGVTLPGNTSDPDHPRLEAIPRGDQHLLPRVLDTDLFALSAEGHLAPAHRQLAEFLAARRIALLIDQGLPVRRVLSLMTGFDGGIISEFRGLAAWLAAHSKLARQEVIERDPMGTVLHGDVRDFSTPEKRLVLQTLKAETDRNPWLVRATLLASPLGSLAASDMADDFRQALADPARDEAHRPFVLLILQTVRTAAPMPELAEPLMAIVRDDTWSMTIRRTALEAYMRARRDDPQVAVMLRRLLDDVYNGVVATRNDDLLGTLLSELYPDDLSVADLVGYLREPARRNLWRRYGVFWMDELREKSTIEQMVQLLDLLKTPMERVRLASGSAPREVNLVVRTPVVLLRHLLEHSPERVSQEQLSHWLYVAGWLGQKSRSSYPGRLGDTKFFRDWLNKNPEVQKAVIEDGVRKYHDIGQLDRYIYYLKRYLFGATPPDDYGVWCAERALTAGNQKIAQWFVWEAAAFVYAARGHDRSHRAEVAGKLRRDNRLTTRFESRLAALEEQSRFDEELNNARQADEPPNDGRFDNLRGWVKANAAALHSNECRPDLLHELAKAYLNGFSDVRGETPEERLRFLLGPDDGLFSAAMAGLRGTIRRADLPKWTEVLELAAKGRTHYLASPFVVGLEENSRATDAGDSHLSDAQTRLALAIHFARHLEGSKGPPRWLRNCLVREPDTVAEVWARCARVQFRKGQEWLADAHRLAREPEYAQLAEVASVPLLRAFPVRCAAGQLPILRSLLQAAASHANRAQFLNLIEAKLAYGSMNPGQRVCWLTAGLFVGPETYGDRLESYVSGKNRRVQRLAEMLDTVPSTSAELWDATVLERLIRVIGPYSVAPPTGETYRVTWPIQADESLRGIVDRLSQDTSAVAGHALEALAADDRLSSWRSLLVDRIHRQKSISREANYAHSGLDQVAAVLDNGRPVSAADLWALTIDLLRQLAERIQDGATSDWRQYWNVDKYNRPEQPKPENACRDALLSDLEQALAHLGIESTKEGSYADDKQSDIRASIPGSNVPIEIKRSCHRELWSAMHTQLIAKYTRDPGTDGYGIYLVFWFGEAERCRPTPRSGPKPKSARELEQALLETLTDAERRKISVCVIDVSKPVS